MTAAQTGNVAQSKVHIIGISDDGLPSLTGTAQQLIHQAEVLIGSQRTLELVGQVSGQRCVLGGDLEELVQRLQDRGNRRVVVLAPGDPLFYGVARYLCDRLGKDQFEVVPHVSSMQLAFARVKESWEEAYLTNLATRPLESSLERIRVSEKVGLFTTDEMPPQAVARSLLEAGLDYFTGYVCENLGSPDERVTVGELADLGNLDFAPLNCVILVRKPGVPDRPSDAVGRRIFGNPDEAFSQSKPKRGLLTPREVRALALAELDLAPQSVLWDVGAGSGSVAIEGAQLASSGQVYAIEVDPEDHELILSNAQRFHVENLEAILGRAPEVCERLPDPDAVFIGGTGRDVLTLVEAAYRRLKPGGRLVTNLGSVENLEAVYRSLHADGTDVNVWMINIARGNYQLERLRFEAINPTFLISVVKPAAATHSGRLST